MTDVCIVSFKTFCYWETFWLCTGLGWNADHGTLSLWTGRDVKSSHSGSRCQIFCKLNMNFTHNMEITPMGIYPAEIKHSCTAAYTGLFRATVVVITRNLSYFFSVSFWSLGWHYSHPVYFQSLFNILKYASFL